MRILSLVSMLVLGLSQAALADVYHQGYVRSNGTYVQPHYQTAPDHSQSNNYSTQGNYNPYTGQEGHQRIGVSPSYNNYQYRGLYNSNSEE
jgi:hypothetical protein